MHQAVDKQIVETDEEAKAGHAGDNPGEDVAYLILHEVALQPVGDFARRFISAAFGHRAVLAQLQHLFHAVVPAAGLRAVAFMPLLFGQQIFDGAVQRQIRVTTDRRGEVGIGLQREAKVAAVFRIVDRLLHRPQEHRLKHLRIRAIGDGGQQFGVIARLRLVAARQFQPQLRQHAAERGNRLGARLIVNTEQRRLLRLLNEARGGDVRQDHALFNQLVRIVPLGLFDTLDTALGVEDEFSFFTFK